MLELMTREQWIVTSLGFGGGIVLGLAARFGGFCTLGAIESFLYSGKQLRLRMWALAIGLSAIALHGLMAAGLFDPSSAGILQQRWIPAGSVVGGLAFGYGMALAGSCGYGALARLGTGDMRAFMILLVMGIAAYATLSGLLASARVTLFPQIPIEAYAPTIPAWIESLTGLPGWAVGLAIGVAAAAFAIASRELRASPGTVFWSIAIAAAVTSGWFGSYLVATNGFEPVMVTSHTFSAPVGETMLFAMTASGAVLTFGIGSVLGVLAGSFAGSVMKGSFSWEACDDARELRRQLLGAILMGTGAVVALGCSIGQGLSAMSLLSISAPVTLAAIFAGAALGLRQLISGLATAK